MMFRGRRPRRKAFPPSPEEVGWTEGGGGPVGSDEGGRASVVSAEIPHSFLVVLEALDFLAREIRSTFDSPLDFSARTTSRARYLLKVVRLALDLGYLHLEAAEFPFRVSSSSPSRFSRAASH